MAVPHLKKTQNIILVCETLDYSWDERQLIRAVGLWDEGFTVPERAKYFKRLQDEVVIMLLHVLNKKQKRDLFSALRRGYSLEPKVSTFECMD